MLDRPVIVALDVPDQAAALAMADQLDPAACRVKVGKELFTAAGPSVVDALHGRGFELFLDLKFHDIPNTVAGACRVARRLGVWLLTIHASGGVAMMRAAKDATGDDVHVVAVTVLTSLDQQGLSATGVVRPMDDHVIALAEQAVAAGLDGVVCSALEASRLRTNLGVGPWLVTPGIRPAGTPADDQARVMTPVDAISAGSSFLVVGRAITESADPGRALADINQSLGIS